MERSNVQEVKEIQLLIVLSPTGVETLGGQYPKGRNLQIEFHEEYLSYIPGELVGKRILK